MQDEYAAFWFKIKLTPSLCYSLYFMLSLKLVHAHVRVHTHAGAHQRRHRQIQRCLRYHCNTLLYSFRPFSCY